MDLHYVFMVLAAVLAGLHNINADDASNFNSKKIYCGRHLSQTLSTVCKGNYNTLNKKSDIYQITTHFGTETQHNLDYPFRSKASASSLMTNFRRRRRRGVFNECCEKPCSQEELSSYCGSRKR